MRHIKITENNLGSERVLFDEDFSKLLMITDVSVGVVDFDSLDDIFSAIDIITTSYFLKHMEDDASRKDVFYMKLVFTIHILMTIIADLIDEDVTEKFKDVSANLMKALADIAREASEDCSYMDAIDMANFKEYIGEELMKELEEYERRQDEE